MSDVEHTWKGNGTEADTRMEDSPLVSSSSSSWSSMASSSSSSLSMLASNADANPNHQDIEIETRPKKSISTVRWASTSPYRLSVSSWDMHAYVFDVDAEMETCVEKGRFAHEAAVLDSCFSMDGSQLYTGGVEGIVREFDVETSTCIRKVSEHEKPIRFLRYSASLDVLISGSWDKTVKLWDCRRGRAVHVIELGDRVHGMDVHDHLVAAAVPARRIQCFDCRNSPTSLYDRTSMLNHQTRSISFFSNGTGLAIGSVEGRCAIVGLNQMRNDSFTFKAHREKQNVYAVNCIHFHPYGTFATCGSDGSFHFWDKDHRAKLKSFKKCPQPINWCEFSKDGELFAYSVSYDWSKGASGYQPTAPNLVYLHHVRPVEVVPRSSDSRSSRR